jgi:hypothetical protein
MRQFVIRCGSMKEFLTVVAGLVERGICFAANTTDLEVRCTGGF